MPSHGRTHFLKWVQVAPLLCFGFAWLVSRTEVFQGLEWRTLDWRTEVRAARGQPPPDERILVIGVGDTSTKNIEPWPFRRTYHAQLLELAVAERPALWVWDVIFPNRRDRTGRPLDGDSDADFADATRSMTASGIPVVFAAVSSPDPTGDSIREAGVTRPLVHIEGRRSDIPGDPEVELPYPGLRTSGHFGMVDAPRGAGGIVRQLPMLVRVGDEVFPSLSLQAAMQYWRLEPEEVRVVLGRAIHLGAKAEHRSIPIDGTGALTVNSRYEKMEPGDPLGSEIPTIEYFDQIVALHQKHVVRDPTARPPVDMTNKIVLVGEFATDTAPSPRREQSPLVLVHANALNSILRNDYVSVASPPVVWGGALLVGFAGILGLRRRSILVVVVFTLAVLVAYTVLAFAAWDRASLRVPLAAPVLGFLLLQFVVIVLRVLEEQSARAHLRAMFGSYLSPELMQQMLRVGAVALIGGERRAVTVLFSDLRNFTAWSESTPEDVLIKQLNEYLAAMVECIHAEGGTLHKFIGDAVMAVWGDLRSGGPEADATAACRAALRMQARLRELNVTWAADGRHQHRMGIGLNHGPVIVGNVGSPQRMEFTVIGDPVNLAARLESLTKELGVEILVGETVHALVSGQFALVEKGAVTVKGKSVSTRVFELTDQGRDPGTAGCGSGR